jgi:hypothetical protein
MVIQIKDMYGKLVRVKMDDDSAAEGILTYYNFDNETVTLNEVTHYSRTYSLHKKVLLINKNKWTTLELM